MLQFASIVDTRILLCVHVLFFLIGDSKCEASSILMRFGFPADRRLEDRGSWGFVSLFGYFFRISIGFSLVLPLISLSVVFSLITSKLSIINLTIKWGLLVYESFTLPKLPLGWVSSTRGYPTSAENRLN